MKTHAGRDFHAWFALADTDACRLFRCSLTKQGTRQVEEHGALENVFPEHEHQRPQTGDGMTHDREEKERRFAGEIVAWLQKRAVQFEFNQLVLYSPPHMLGVLRTVPLGSLKGRVEELKGDLMHLTAGQLADHPMIREGLTLYAVRPEVRSKAERAIKHAVDETS
jgi:protein required for attachment to host cells